MTDGNRVSVNYVGDLVLSIREDVVKVENNRDYVEACAMISHAPRTGQALEIWVRSRTHYIWLRDFTDQIGCPAGFEEKTARKVLADLWNVEIPDWLTDEDVIAAGLLEKEFDGRAPMNFVDRFLSRSLGDVFRAVTLDASNLVGVVSALVSDDVRGALKGSSLLARCLEEKCREWAAGSHEPWARELSDHISERPVEVWRWLSTWAGLHGYPQKILDYALPPPQARLVRQIPADALEGLPLEPTAVEQITTQIDLFFREISDQVDSSDAFRKVVEGTSGRLLPEFIAVSRLLDECKFSPLEADVQAIQEKFRSCPGITAGRLDSLARRVQPDRPEIPEPDEAWNDRDWVRWTIKEYVPYRRWQTYNEVYDQELEGVVAHFSDWYIDEYEAIHQNAGLTLIHSLKDLSVGSSKDELSIVLLVDCLPLTFATLLDNSLRRVGLSRHMLEYRFAALPTATEFNKPQLIEGTWEADPDRYQEILQTRAESDWGGKKTVYLPDLRALAEMEAPSEPAVVLLNLGDVDERLHRDVERENTTHEEELGRLFARVAEAVIRLSETWSGTKEAFGIYVVTDHGACRVLDEEGKSFDSEVVSRLFPDERHRFAVIDRDRADDIPENLWAFGHRFVRPFASDDRVYFIPRGHNTVRRRGKFGGYMHGGATPEEVIVPVAAYRLERAARKHLGTRFRGLISNRATGRATFYIQRVTAVEIEIQNPNPIEVRIVRASISSPETDLKGCETPIVPAYGEGILHMHCYFKRSALKEGNLEVEIIYEIGGDTYTLPLRHECEFKSAVSGGFSLKDL